MKKKKFVIVSGAGISAESGLSTFRDSGGLWNNHSIEEVATPEAWQKNPTLVLDFYNMRRKEAFAAKPNSAHIALAKLESKYEVSIITQNVDDLHERAGSSNVIHLHGLLKEARSDVNDTLIQTINDNPIKLGDYASDGNQLRPNIVWFGEIPHHFDRAIDLVSEADAILIVGTSLSVYPAANLVHYADNATIKTLVAPDIDHVPHNYDHYADKAGTAVPMLVERWLTAP
ncbi:SIR2 family NAD-dependent protein deacylase [Marinomonas balearica]|uniref:protein acetyllysine N-acetyltransferase n=1 Tax=Marinomonas balearica TaxID=491947 RepID=A0A4R6M4V4_9GAMM|nr:NAD-dependent deacylase [Marinomonas balearica]TDO96333.1 NAD-dependent deacetylase [Marinomonas balearica]